MFLAFFQCCLKLDVLLPVRGPKPVESPTHPAGLCIASCRDKNDGRSTLTPSSAPSSATHSPYAARTTHGPLALRASSAYRTSFSGMLFTYLSTHGFRQLFAASFTASEHRFVYVSKIRWHLRHSEVSQSRTRGARRKRCIETLAGSGLLRRRTATDSTVQCAPLPAGGGT